MEEEAIVMLVVVVVLVRVVSIGDRCSFLH